MRYVCIHAFRVQDGLALYTADATSFPLAMDVRVVTHTAVRTSAFSLFLNQVNLQVERTSTDELSTCILHTQSKGARMMRGIVVNLHSVYGIGRKACIYGTRQCC